MRYYQYISQTKIDMLYSQLNLSTLSDAEVSAKASLGFIQATYKKNNEKSFDEPIEKLPLIEKYLTESNLCGGIRDDKKFVYGKSPLLHKITTSESTKGNDIAFWGGVFGGVNFALIGSIGSLIGSSKDTEYNHSINFYRVALNRFAEHIDAKEKESPSMKAFNEMHIEETKPVIEYLLRDNSEYQNLEYLAKVIYSDNELVLASPLFVAEDLNS